MTNDEIEYLFNKYVTRIISFVPYCNGRYIDINKFTNNWYRVFLVDIIIRENRELKKYHVYLYKGRFSDGHLGSIKELQFKGEMLEIINEKNQ